MGLQIWKDSLKKLKRWFRIYGEGAGHQTPQAYSLRLIAYCLLLSKTHRFFLQCSIAFLVGNNWNFLFLSYDN